MKFELNILIVRAMFYLPGVFVFTSCQKVINDFNPKGTQERIVIDGLVTDSLTRHYVRVTKTTSYTNPQAPPVVSNALVVINDNVSLCDTLEYIGNGYYLSKLWAGVQGRVYSLEVYSEGQLIQASEQMQMLPHFKIDSITTRFDNVVEKDFKSSDFNDYRFFYAGDTVYKAYFYAIEDQSVSNYYLFDIKRNSADYTNQDDIMVADDGIIQENITGLELPGLFLRGDTVTAIMYGLSRNCFKYYEGLRNVMNFDGGMFSPPAGNPPTNLSGQALGYFQVSPQYTLSEIVNP